MKGMMEVPDKVIEDGPTGLDPDDTKKFFDTYFRDRVDTATKRLIEFLIEHRALKSTTSVTGSFKGKWIEDEKPRPDTSALAVDESLLRQIALVYARLAEPEHLADRLTQLALALDEVWRLDQGQVFLYKLIMLIQQGNESPEINDVNMMSWGQFAYHVREQVSLVRKVMSIERAKAFVKGLQPTVGAMMRDLVGARRSSLEARMLRTDKVKTILQEHSKLRSADRARIAILVGVHFGDERPPRSEESSVNRLNKRRERHPKRP